MSEPLRRHVARVRGSDKGTVVIPNGVEPRPHLDLPRQRGGDAETLVFLGHPKPWHGAERLVPLLSELRLAGRDTRLLVIGGGQGAEDIAQAVSRFGVAESVEITGPLSHARATRELLRGTVLVAPYPRHEPFYFCPLKVLEGMAAGLPVVVSDQGDIAALVGDAGVLVDPDDDDALRGEVLALLEAPDRRHELGRLGRERALAHFTWRAAAARLTEAVALEPKRWRSEPIRGGAAVVSNLTSQLPASLDVGDLSSLLDEDLLLELLSDSGISAHCVSPRYIRLKPNVGALVAIELEADSREGERVTHQGYVRTHPGSRAAALAQKWAAKRAAPSPLGDGVRLLATKQSVLFLFPQRREPAGPGSDHRFLQVEAGPSRVTRAAPRWLPSPRAAQPTRGRALQARAPAGDAGHAEPEERARRPPRRAQRVLVFLSRRYRPAHRPPFEVARSAARWATRARFPRRARWRANRCGTGRRRLPGAFRVALRPARARSGGRAIAAAPCFERPQALDLPEAQPLETALEATQVLATLGVDAVALASRLQTLAPSRPVEKLVHGDCHLDQLLVAPDGRAVVVDFERLAIGNPLADPRPTRR